MILTYAQNISGNTYTGRLWAPYPSRSSRGTRRAIWCWPLDIIELTEQSVGKDPRHGHDDVMVLKDCEDTPFTTFINRRSSGSLGGREAGFQFEISKENFTRLMTEKAAG